MKKLLPLLALAFLLIATPAFASKNSENNNSQTQASCEEDAENHGQFVSCVAHLHEGGQTASEAAKSDIGKKDHDEDGDDDDEVSPSTSPSPTVSPSPSASPSPSPSP